MDTPHIQTWLARKAKWNVFVLNKSLLQFTVSIASSFHPRQEGEKHVPQTCVCVCVFYVIAIFIVHSLCNPLAQLTAGGV